MPFSSTALRERNALSRVCPDLLSSMIAVCGKEAIEKGAHAGMIIKEIAALAGGKGGGRPDSAMAGVSEIFKIDEALAQLPSVVQKLTEK